jgi:glutamate-1-semialdehyde 2,1-aminomutase
MSIAQDPVDGPIGQALWARADQVLPGGGIYYSRSADFAGRGVLPGFIASAQGCRVTDVDGRTYIDFLCANGPNILGYRHPEVEAAARRQAEQQTSASFFPPALVEVIERLVARVPGMAFGVTSKNGSEVVSLGVRMARQHTGRRTVITFDRAYHGSDPELANRPPPGPLSDGVRDIVRLPWNDPQRLADHCAAHADTTAAILLNPLDQNPGLQTVAPSPEFLGAIRAAQARHDIQLVFDDVRHGFRLDPVGSFRPLGLEPDVAAFGKALGTGYAISALVAREHLRAAARKIFYTSTFMFEASAMAAAMAMLEIYERDNVFAHITAMGERLRAGILAAAAKAGQAITYTGPVTMPTLLLADDPGGARLKMFARAASGRGAILHPNLNWNLSGAHQPADIDETIAIAAEAFAETPGPG